MRNHVYILVIHVGFSLRVSTMFEGLVRQLILGYLGRYIKDIQKEKLKITLWNGNSTDYRLLIVVLFILFIYVMLIEKVPEII